MLFKIAIKNLLGARLRTFLNVLVTAFSFFLILFMSAMYDGMLEHAKQVTMDTEIAGVLTGTRSMTPWIPWFLKMLILFYLRRYNHWWIRIKRSRSW